MQEIKRPWGYYQVLYEYSEQYKVKRLHLNAEQKISLQYHFHRNEHWIVVDGDGIVTVGDDSLIVSSGDYIFVPSESIHRITAGISGITIIEVQQGSLCDEDDIVRIEDDYNRI